MLDSSIKDDVTSRAPMFGAVGRAMAGLMAGCGLVAVLPVIAAILVTGAQGAAAGSGGEGELEACCLPTGQCVEIPVGLTVCTELLDGIPRGAGTRCVTDFCRGACCFPKDGECLEGLGFGECEDIDGTFAGFGLDCEPVPCGLPLGACCIPDGDCVGEVSENNCLLSLGGTWTPGASCDAITCCAGDVNQDGQTDFDDLVAMLARWGPCSPALSCPLDLDGDDVVGFTDLTSLLADFGCD